MIIYGVTLSNNTASAATVTMYMGATGANASGTELMKGLSVPANSVANYYWPGGLNVAQADFIVGGSGTATAITAVFTGEQGIGA